MDYSYANDGKLESRAKKCEFLGYTDGIKEFRSWDPSTSRIITDHDVTFNDLCFFMLRDHRKTQRKLWRRRAGMKLIRKILIMMFLMVIIWRHLKKMEIFLSLPPLERPLVLGRTHRL